MADTQRNRWALPCAIAWSVVVAFGGGMACGWCIDQFGTAGAISLAACGALAGYVSRKITRHACKVAGICQVIGVCAAFLVAETCWLHWNTGDGEPSWGAAIRVWPVFLREYMLSALIGAVCTAYGAWSAYGFATSLESRAHEPAGPIAPPP